MCDSRKHRQFVYILNDGAQSISLLRCHWAPSIQSIWRRKCSLYYLFIYLFILLFVFFFVFQLFFVVRQANKHTCTHVQIEKQVNVNNIRVHSSQYIYRIYHLLGYNLAFTVFVCALRLYTIFVVNFFCCRCDVIVIAGVLRLFNTVRHSLEEY